MEEENDDMSLLKKQIEDEFIAAIAVGEDIRAYLYLPHGYVTPLMKKHLDEFLINQAYKEIEVGNLKPDSFLVYQDDMLTVTLKEKDQKLKLIDDMLSYFTKKEEYEKCKKIHDLKIQIN